MPPNDTMWTWHPNDIKRVIIKRGITKICEQAFYGLSYLESISIPDSVTQIEASSFYACNSLGSVNNPSSVNKIGWNAFIYCRSLNTVRINNPNCYIYPSSNTFSNSDGVYSGVIEGYYDSTAMSYAKSFNRAFKSIDSPVTTTTTLKKSTSTTSTTTITTTLPTSTTVLKITSVLNNVYVEVSSTPSEYLNTDMSFDKSVIKKAVLYAVYDVGYSSSGVRVNISQFADSFDITDQISFGNATPANMFDPLTGSGSYDIPLYYDGDDISDKDGNIILKNGSRFYDNNGRKAVLKVNINEVTTTTLLPLKVNETEITLTNGGQYTIKANQTGLTYRSNDTNVAVVSKNGVITAIGEGEAVISVYNSDFDVVQLKCKVLKKGNYVYGDANIDGTVDISDAVLIMQNLSNPSKYGENGTDKAHITAKGIKYGDVSGNGDGLTNKDALAIQRYMLKLISSLPE